MAAEIIRERFLNVLNVLNGESTRFFEIHDQKINTFSTKLFYYKNENLKKLSLNGT